MHDNNNTQTAKKQLQIEITEGKYINADGGENCEPAFFIYIILPPIIPSKEENKNEFLRLIVSFSFR